MRCKRWLSLLLCLAMVMSMSGQIPVVKAQETEEQPSALPEITEGYQYGDYLQEHGEVTDENTPDVEIRIQAADCSNVMDSGGYITEYMGKNGILYWDTVGGTATWSFTVEQEGYYQLDIGYNPIAGKNYDIVIDVLLDGEQPYVNAGNVNLHRTFLDESYQGMDDNNFRTNLNGDEIRPALVEQFSWKTQTVTDSQNEYSGPMYFYLTPGEHTVSLRLKEESLALSELVFHNATAVPTYSQMLQEWGGEDSTGIMQEYEAEKSYLKNSITLFPTYDTAYVHVTPSSPENVFYNTIGKDTWKTVGQEITWEFSVPEDGYYYLAFKVKQNAKSNSYSTRQITIDGSSLYQEMETQKFGYNSSWYIQQMQDEDGTPLKVYLTAGKHVLGMTAALDDELTQVLRNVSDVTDELQKWYREIIRVTGFNADGERITVDLNRDFNLEKVIPGLMEGLEACKQNLDTYNAQISQISGMSKASASILGETSTLLADMIKRPNKIAQRLETFRTNISTMATWAIDMQEQPLVMDKFYVYSPDMATPTIYENAFLGFFAQIFYRIQLFFNSFFSSTTAIAGDTENTEGSTTIRVWISTADITTTGASSGRDQAIILKKLIDESFTADTGVNVEVSLVNSSDTLVQAVLAGEGPDVALFTSVDTPVNLAMRGLLLDLSQFEGYEKVLENFTESAYKPFYYKDGLYAFPETQSFNLLFYRSDVYEELGLTPPETWEEFYEQIVVLANNNYMVGIPQNQNIFETFLYQSGTTFYNEDLSKSTFDTSEALDAFASWTDLYTKYSLSLTFDFFNRFRSGEMAAGIMPYNQVNYLYSAAPELDGLWSIAQVPGTVQPDGTVSRVETSTSTGGIALADTQHPREAFDFLSWWVSTETQAAFGIQVEQTLGVAARYGTANVEAFEQLPWAAEQADVMRSQRENTAAIEQVPGSYYIARNLSFAFRAVVYNKANVRATMYKYNAEINKELERKQKEFNY